MSLPLATADETDLQFGWWTADQWSLAASIGTTVAALFALLGICVGVAQLVLTRRASVEQSLPYVVATADPAFSHARNVRLRIQNYGPTIAFKVNVEFPDIVYMPTGPVVTEVPMPVSVLAPGQVVHQWLMLSQEDPDELGAYRAPVVVSYEDWRGKPHRQEYELVSMHVDSDRDPARRLADAADQVARMVKGAMSGDGKSLVVESHSAAMDRIFGGPGMFPSDKADNDQP